MPDQCLHAGGGGLVQAEAPADVAGHLRAGLRMPRRGRELADVVEEGGQAQQLGRLHLRPGAAEVLELLFFRGAQRLHAADRL